MSAKDAKNFTELASDGFYVSRMPFYAVLYPKLRQVAYEHGYALCLHGSLTKDLDVLAVPWVGDAADFVTLVTALVHASGGFVTTDGQGNDTTHKPHGRRAVTIHLNRGGYIDLSVMPRSAA